VEPCCLKAVEQHPNTDYVELIFRFEVKKNSLEAIEEMMALMEEAAATHTAFEESINCEWHPASNEPIST